MANYRDLVKDRLYLRRSQSEYKVLIAFIKKHKIKDTYDLIKYLNLKEKELKDYLNSSEKSSTMTALRRKKVKELDWISFVKKNYLPLLK